MACKLTTCTPNANIAHSDVLISEMKEGACSASEAKCKALENVAYLLLAPLAGWVKAPP